MVYASQELSNHLGNMAIKMARMQVLNDNLTAENDKLHEANKLLKSQLKGGDTSETDTGTGDGD